MRPRPLPSDPGPSGQLPEEPQLPGPFSRQQTGAGQDEGIGISSRAQQPGVVSAPEIRAAGEASLASVAVTTALAPLDELRRLSLRLGGRPLVALLARRELRVTVVGTISVACALAIVGMFPLWTVLLGPLVLGVPHLLADVRYLIVRPGLHRRAGFFALVALPLAATLIVPKLPLGLLAVAGACLIARAPLRTRIAAALAFAAVALAVLQIGRSADIVFAHVHNLVAVGLWWWWRPRRPLHQVLPLLAFVAGLVGISVGTVEVWSIRAGGLAPIMGGGLGVEEFASSVSLFADPVWALRALLIFTFGQSVHYAVWLRLVPDDDRPRPGLRSFRSSFRALLADCGAPLLALAAALALALIVGAAFDAYGARTLYLRFALFHGPLEIAVIAVRLLDRAPRAAFAPAQAVS
jgi:hypothetical protein